MKNKKQPVIGIIGGTGRMGQWFQNFFHTQGISVLISGRKTKLTGKALAAKSDIIIVSVPIAEVESVLEEIIPVIKPTSLLSDVTSLKLLPLKVMEKSKSATLGMHPLFGPAIADPAGQKIVFCRQNDNQYVPFLKTLFEKAGIAVIELSAEEHDYHMAYVQALTHALNLLYAKILFEQSDALSKKLDTPLFMLQSLVMGRVLHQDLGLSADIEMFNPYFLPLLENLAGYSKQLLDILQSGDRKAFVKLFEKDQRFGEDFANFATLHTDKMLKLVVETHASLPSVGKILLPEKDTTIGYLGPAGTYSHQAVQTIFPSANKKLPFGTIFQVFNAVLDEDVSFGIVPAENSIEGTVKGTLDYLADFSVSVVGSFALPIHHQLVSSEKNLAEITEVISHPQALAQCEQWLRTNLPKAKITPSSSTTAGIDAKKKHTGFITSETAAKLYKLPVLAKNIEDNPRNTTRFYLIAKYSTEIKGLSNKRTLLFLTIYNRVGILRDILNVIADNDINMTKLESRPSSEKIWDYHFFVEVDCKYTEKRLTNTLGALKSFCPVIRVLGQT